MTPNAQKALVAVSGIIILVNGFGLVSGARAAKKSTLELVTLRQDMVKIDAEITRLRAQVDAYEKAKAEAASAATATTAATPATK